MPYMSALYARLTRMTGGDFEERGRHAPAAARPRQDPAGVDAGAHIRQTYKAYT